MLTACLDFSEPGACWKASMLTLPADSTISKTDYVLFLQVSGGFVGTIVGVFATGNGRNVSASAFVSNWSYFGRDSMY
jgi:hypothetical protein